MNIDNNNNRNSRNIITTILNDNKKYNNSMTKCTKSGIKINKSNNEYKEDPFNNADPFEFRKHNNNLNTNNIEFKQREIKSIDLNIDNYSQKELFGLFQLDPNDYLNEERLKHAKKIVLQMHPDKSHLQPEYFIFYKKGYEKLYSIAEFQNAINKANTKTNSTINNNSNNSNYSNNTNNTNNTNNSSNINNNNVDYNNNLNNNNVKILVGVQKNKINLFNETNQTNQTNQINETNEFCDNSNKVILDNLFESNKNLKKSANFNEWFNQQFEKHKLDEPNDNGYNDWLKSDEDIIFTPQNLSKTSMDDHFNKLKKNMQQLTPYKGYDNNITSSCYGTALIDYNTNFNSNSMFNNGLDYSDLKQAYVESIIPVTEDDYSKIYKYKDVNELKNERSVVLDPLNKEESMNKLYFENKKSDEEAVALAYYFAQQSEKALKKQEEFWGSLKQLTYFDKN